MAEILMNKKDWEEIRKGVNDAFESKKINVRQKSMFLAKQEKMLSNYGGKFEKLTKEQVDALYKEYNELVKKSVKNEVNNNALKSQVEGWKKRIDALWKHHKTEFSWMDDQEINKHCQEVCKRSIEKLDGGKIQTKKQFTEEFNALKLWYKIVSKIENIEGYGNTQVMDEALKVSGTKGVLEGLAFIKENKNKIIADGEQKAFKVAKKDLMKARMDANKDKEKIVLSQLGFDKANDKCGYWLFKYFFTKECTEGKHDHIVKLYRVKVDDLKKNLINSYGTPKNILDEKLEDANSWVVFADKNDYDNCCKNISKAKFYKIRDLFEEKNNLPYLEWWPQDLKYYAKEISKLISRI